MAHCVKRRQQELDYREAGEAHLQEWSSLTIKQRMQGNVSISTYVCL